MDPLSRLPFFPALLMVVMLGAGLRLLALDWAQPLRLVGDDARYVTRPGRTSPPFPEHGMTDGDRLRDDWFPTLVGGAS